MITKWMKCTKLMAKWINLQSRVRDNNKKDVWSRDGGTITKGRYGRCLALQQASAQLSILPALAKVFVVLSFCLTVNLEANAVVDENCRRTALVLLLMLFVLGRSPSQRDTDQIEPRFFCSPTVSSIFRPISLSEHYELYELIHWRDKRKSTVTETKSSHC